MHILLLFSKATTTCVYLRLILISKDTLALPQSSQGVVPGNESLNCHHDSFGSNIFCYSRSGAYSFENVTVPHFNCKLPLLDSEPMTKQRLIFTLSLPTYPVQLEAIQWIFIVWVKRREVHIIKHILHHRLQLLSFLLLHCF